ncbi:MAG: hypothetical protein ACHP83_09345 [Burkholderiales bacterium]
MRTMQRLVVSAFALLCSASWGQAAPPGGGGVYRCKDDQGHYITRDRYIAECWDKEQEILNPDGSRRSLVPPTLTPDERARREAAEQAKRDAEAARKDAIKYDRNLLRRYPDKAAHDKDRASALERLRLAIQSAEARLQELAAERKRLADEAEFYRGRPLPPALKQQLEGNDVSAAAQRNAIKNSQAEQERINVQFDVQLARLRNLWGDAQPGSLGPPPQ